MSEGVVGMVEHLIRRIAGSLILISVALSVWVSPQFLWVSVFVGLNLLQSSFTRWCFLEDVLNGRVSRRGR